MDHGVLASDHGPGIQYRGSAYESRIPGAFGPGRAVPVAGVLLGGSASADDLFDFLAGDPPARLPVGCHVRVPPFLESLGMGEREVVLACRYRSAVDAVLRGGVPFLRSANDAGWSGAAFAADPVFPNVRHSVVLSAIARRCLDDSPAGPDEEFVKAWFRPHLAGIQDGVFASRDSKLRTEFLRSVPVRYASDSTISEVVRPLLDEGRFDVAEFHRWGKLLRALRCVAESAPEGEELSGAETALFEASLRYLNRYQLAILLRTCLRSGQKGACRMIADLPVDFGVGDLRTAAWFIRRAARLEELLADALAH